MTQNVQTSLLSHSRIYSEQSYPGNIYNVVINCEDGEYYEYEIEADTFAQATEIAEQMANDLMADITYIEVYKAA
jgi:phosphoribosylformylglycinamidine (FGAM) synthase PurS component